MGFDIAELTELSDLEDVVRLFSEVWGGAALIDSNTLRALAHSGNYIAGARSGGRLIGALMGWLGARPGGDVILHSHILAVVPDVEARGLGFALKQHQRGWCLSRSIRTIEWTFDPLVRRNAYFNLTKLGADAAEYLVNFYGPMQDSINAGDESDRILVRWRLESERAKAAAFGQGPEPEFDEAAGRALTVGAGAEPQSRAVSGPAIVIQVPEDIVAIRRHDADLAKRWRHAVRKALGDAMASGFHVAGATRDGWYVLARD